MIRRMLFILIILLCAAGLPVYSMDNVFDSAFLFQAALNNNLELQKLDVARRQAETDVKNAEAERLPKIDFQSTFSWLSKPLIEPITLTAGELGSYDIGGTSVLLPSEDMKIYGGMENTNYDFKFIIDQPVFTWGKITNAINLYSKAFETSELNIQSKQKEIKTTIDIYFHSLYFIGLIEKSLEQQLVDAERMISIADESYKNGFILYAELLQAKIQAKELSVSSAKLTQQKEAAFLALSRLTGIKDLSEEKLDFSRIQNIEDIKILDKDTYFTSALENSPEIKMLDSLKNINNLKIDISRSSKAYKPDIGLHVELGYSGPRFPFIETDWFGQDSLALTTTLAVQTTVYEGGKQELQIEKDTDEFEKSSLEYDLGIESISNVISESILKLELNRQNIDYYRLLQENDMQQIQLKQTQIDAGSGNESDLLAEKINLNVHKIKEYNESVEFYRNYFTLLGAASAER